MSKSIQSIKNMTEKKRRFFSRRLQEA